MSILYYYVVVGYNPTYNYISFLSSHHASASGPRLARRRRRAGAVPDRATRARHTGGLCLYSRTGRPLHRHVCKRRLANTARARARPRTGTRASALFTRLYILNNYIHVNCNGAGAGFGVAAIARDCTGSVEGGPASRAADG